MRKGVLAVFDSDLGYVERFLKHLKTRRNLPFTGIGFSDLSSLEQFLERGSIDILLLSDQLAAPSLLDKLHEEPNISEILISGDKQDTESRQKYIYKYRACDSLINDVITACRLEGYESLLSVSGKGILGIYSPADGMFRQRFALAVAETMAGDRSVLYLNLDRFSGMRHLKSADGPSISDLIYFFKTNPKKIREEVHKTLIKRNGVDMILAPCDMEDMDLIEDEGWGEFLGILSECGNYDQIILDMSEAFRKTELIFSVCEKVIIPFCDDSASRERVDELLAFLEEKEGERITEKLFMVKLAALKMSPESPYDMERVVQSLVTEEEIRKKAERFCFEYERETT